MKKLSLVFIFLLVTSLIPGQYLSWADSPDQEPPQVAVQSVWHVYEGNTIRINANITNGGGPSGPFNVTFRIIRPLEMSTIEEVPWEWENISNYIRNLSAVRSGSHVNGTGAVLRDDDGYLVYKLPFSFDYMGRKIERLSISTNGVIELLGRWEEPRVRGDYGVHRYYSNSDLIFALDDDLETEDGYLAVVGFPDRVVIEWFGSTYKDYDASGYPLKFQVVIFSNRTVRWSYLYLRYSDHDYDMFSGYYSRVSRDERGFPAEEGKTFEVSLSEVIPEIRKEQIPSLPENGSTVVSTTVPAENVYIEVIADEEEVLDDDLRGNNFAFLSVWPGDYWVENVSVSRELKTGEDAEFLVRVRTNSTRPGDTYLKLLMNDTPVEETYIDGDDFTNGTTTARLRWRVQGGSYRLGVRVENPDDTNSTNNYYPIGEANLPVPNFRIVNYSIEFPSCSWSYANVSVNVTNDGSANWSGSVAVGVWLRYASGDYTWDDYYISGLPAGEIREVLLRPLLKTGNLTGIIVWIDPHNRVVEGNEDDNLLNISYSREISYPDFAVLDIETPGNVTSGNMYNINVTLNNLGGCYGRSVRISLYENGRERDREYVSINDRTVITMQWSPLTVGVVNLTVVVDPNDDVEESNELNNMLSKTITVQGPDIVITNVTLVSFDGVAGSEAIFNVTVKNLGMAFTRSFKVATRNALINDYEYINGLDSGEKRSVLLRPVLNGGTHNLTFVVDPWNYIPEMNESNNEYSYLLSVPQPNFVVERVSYPNNTVGYLPINVTIRNVGMPFNASREGIGVRVATGYGWDIQYLRGFLHHNSTANLSFLLKMEPPGSYINVTVNSYMEINESSFGDNSVLEDYKTGYPDLTLEVSVPEVIAGDYAPVNVTVKNIGNATLNVPRMSYWYYYLPLDVEYSYENGDGGSRTIRVEPVTLKPGESVVKNMYITFNGGVNSINVTIDPNDRWIESNESNNRVSAHVLVPKPDFVVSNYRIPGELENGSAYLWEVYGIGVNVTNLGGNFTDSLLVELYDNGTYTGYDYIRRLSSGESREVLLYYRPTPGSHELTVKVDPDDEWVELNESNSVNLGNFTLGRPELVPLGVTWEPYNFTSGERVTFKAYVMNLGQSFYRSFSVRFEVWNGSSRIAYGSGYLYGSDWHFMENDTREFRWTWYNAKPGNLTLKVIVDYSGRIPEVSEDNNNYTANIGSVGTPDFALENLSVDELAYGKYVSINVTLKNLGEPIYRPFRVLFNISGETHWVTVYGMSNESKRISLRWWVNRVGNVNISVVVDPSNEIVETSEDNNAVHGNYRVETPDLAVKSYEWVRDDVSRGYLTFRVNVTNQGGDTYRGFHVGLYVDGSRKVSLWIPRLLRGEVIERTLRWRFNVGGEHNVSIRVDPEDYVPETDETNNEVSQTVTIELPDIKLLDVSLPGMDANSYDTINVTVKNSGMADVDRSFFVAVFQDERYLGGAWIGSLSSGEERTVGIKVRPYPGDSTFRIIADYYSSVTESNEDNNQLNERVHVRAPDIVVLDLWPGSFSYSGEVATARVRIQNEGDSNSGVFYLAITSGNELLGGTYVSSVSPGEEINVTVNWTVRGGSYNITAAVDPHNSLREWREDNNEVSTEVTVPVPDLVVTSFSHSGIARVGERIGFTITVSNRGRRTLREFYVAVYVNSSLVAMKRVYGIGENETLTIVMPNAWPARYGHYILRAVVDPSNEVIESSEENNEMTEEITIIDDIAPFIREVYPANGSFTNRPVIGVLLGDRGSGVDASRSELHLYRNGEPIGGTTTVSSSWLVFVNSSPLADGNYTLTVVAYDRAGNSANYTATFVLDREPPRIETNLKEGTVYNGSVRPSITVTDPNLDRYSVRINGVEYHGETIAADGDYTLTITARDKAGNVAVLEVNFAVNGIPAPPSGLTFEKNGSYVELSWLPSGSEDVAGYYIYRDGVRLNDVPIEVTHFRDLYVGSLNYTVTAVDYHGLESTPATLFPARVLINFTQLITGYPTNVAVGIENLNGKATGKLRLEMLDLFGDVILSEERNVTLGEGWTRLDFVEIVPEGLAAIKASLTINGSSTVETVPVKPLKGESPKMEHGDLLTGLPGEVKVGITNFGSAPLETSKGVLKLGNVVGELMVGPPVIEPGQSGVLVYRVVPPERGEHNLSFSLGSLRATVPVTVRDPVVNPVSVFTENFVRGSRARIKVTFRNIGSAPLRVESVKVLGMVRRAGMTIEPGLSYTVSFDYTVPLDAPGEVAINASVVTEFGTFWRTVRVETSEPPYNADVNVEPVFEVGERITITGHAQNASGLLPNVPVKVTIAGGGFVRSFLVLTDENGRFNLTFEPFRHESGHFVVSATHPSVETVENDASFDIVGLEVAPQVYRIKVTRDFNGTLRISLRNYWEKCNASVSVSAPSGYRLDVPSMIPLSPGNNWLEIPISGTDVSNGTIVVTFRTTQMRRTLEKDLLINITVLPPEPILEVEPRTLEIGILANESWSGAISIKNVGFDEVRNLSVSSSISWLGITSAPKSLAQGENGSVALYIAPPSNITGRFTGEIVMKADNYRTIKIPVRVTVTPRGTGSLRITVIDTNGTRLSGAKVVMTNEYAHFEGETDENGTIAFTDVPIGDYTLFVSEKSHYTHSETVTVEPGIEKAVRAVLMPSILQVQWEVVPVTIQDVYIIRHEIEYKTYVPAPEIKSEGGDLEVYVNYEKLAEVGVLELRGQLAVTNTHRYVSVYNITFETGGSHYIDVEFAVDKIDELKPGETVIVPYVVKIYHHRSPPINPCLHETKVFQLKAGVVCVEEAGKITLRAQKVHQIVVKPTCDGCLKSTLLLAGKLGFIVLGQKVGSALGSLDPSSISPTMAGEALNNLESIYDALGQAWMNPSDENLKNLAKTFNGAKDNLASLFKEDPVTYHLISSLQFQVVTDENGKVVGFATTLTDRPTYTTAMGVVKTTNGNVQVDWKKAASIGSNILSGISSNLGGALGSIANGLNILQLLMKAAEDLPPYIAQAGLNCAICLLGNNCAPPSGGGEVPVLTVGTAAFGGGDYAYIGGGGGGGSVSVGRFTCEGLPKPEKKGGSPSSSVKSCSTCGVGFRSLDGLRGTESVSGGRLCRRVNLNGPSPEPLQGGNDEKPGNTLHMCIDLIITIEQRLTFERQAFRASLKFTNTNANYSLQNVNVMVMFFDTNLSEANDRFFVRLDEESGLTGGNLPPKGEATMKWLIIPKVGAAEKFRTTYYVMARITARVGNSTLIYDTWPARIDVEPVPQLELDYVIPRKVYGDDPYTPEVEPPVPFVFGVRVRNVGYGVARNLRIASAQPKIERSNYPGVYIDFRIIGTLVNGKKVPNSLTVDFGDLEPGESSAAAWLMTAEVTGEFLQYNATFRHSDELGGNETSLIRVVRTHHLLKAFNNTVNDDGMLDFLIDDDGDGNPEMIIDSTGNDHAVLVVSARVESEKGISRVIPEIRPEGWGFFKIRASGYAVRSDGKNPVLQWREGNYLNVLDFRPAGFYVLKANRPPVPVISYGGPIIVNESVTFDASLSYDPDGEVVRYLWKIGNITFEGRAINVTFATPGNHSISLTVWDDGGANSTVRKKIVVYVGPRFTEKLSVSPKRGIVPFNVTVSLNVTNTGDVAGLYNATLRVDGTEFGWKARTAEPGNWTLFSFEVPIREPGEHRIAVNDLEETITAYRNITVKREESLGYSRDFGHYDSLTWEPFRRDFEKWSENVLGSIAVNTSEFDEVINVDYTNWSPLAYAEGLNITSPTGWINATYERNVTVVGFSGYNYTTLKLVQLVELFANASHRMDTQPPEIEVRPGSGIYAEVPTFNVTVCDESNVTVWLYYWNGNRTLRMVQKRGNCSLWTGSAPLRLGNNTLTVFVRDIFNNTANESLWVYLNPDSPAIHIESPVEEVYNTREVWLNYTVTDYDLVGVEAYLDGYELSSSANYSARVTLDYGWHNLTVMAWDVSSRVSKSVLFRINEPPEVNFTWVSSYLAVTFIPNATDPDGISSYLWDFGDGSTSNEERPTHVYSSGGSYTVTLTVWDGHNLSSSVSRRVEVFANVSRITEENMTFTRDFGFYNTTSWEPFRRDFEKWSEDVLGSIAVNTSEFDEVINVDYTNWSAEHYSENLSSGVESGWINATYTRTAVVRGLIGYNITTLVIVQRANLFANATHVPDVTPPAVKILYPSNVTYDHNVTEVRVKVEDESPIAWVNGQLDGVSFNMTYSGGVWTANVTASDGRHKLIVRASDVYGNVGNASVVFTVNTSIKIVRGNNTTVTIIPGEVETEVNVENGTVTIEVTLDGRSTTFKLPAKGFILVDERIKGMPWLLISRDSRIVDSTEENTRERRNGKVYDVRKIKMAVDVSPGGYSVITLSLGGMRLREVAITKNGTRVTLGEETRDVGYYGILGGYLYIVLLDDPIVEVTLEKVNERETASYRTGVWIALGLAWRNRYLKLASEFERLSANVTNSTLIEDALELHRKAGEYCRLAMSYNPYRDPVKYAVAMRKAYMLEKEALRLLIGKV